MPAGTVQQQRFNLQSRENSQELHDKLTDILERWVRPPVYHCVLPWITVFGCVLRCMAVYYWVWPCITVYGCVLLWITVYYCVLLCITVYGCVLLCNTVLLCITVYHLAVWWVRKYLVTLNFATTLLFPSVNGLGVSWEGVLVNCEGEGFG